MLFFFPAAWKVRLNFLTEGVILVVYNNYIVFDMRNSNPIIHLLRSFLEETVHGF